jgi:hypothetical protein
MATEDIQIRISVLDEATPYLENISKSISSLPKMNLSKAFGTGLMAKPIKFMDGLKEISTLKFKFDADIFNLKTMKSDVKVFDKMIDSTTGNIFAFKNLGDALGVAKISMKDFNIWAGKNNMMEQDGVGFVDQLSGRTLNYGEAVKEATIQTRRFKFEWLSVMFTGMALSRAFNSIVKSQEDLWGWSQMVADMWTITMIPAMELISPIVQNITEKIGELPPDTQLVIGLTVFGLDELGKILTWIGMAFLGIQGLGMAFETLFGVNLGASIVEAGGLFNWLGGVIGGIGITVGIVAAIVIALIISIVTAFNENFMGMKKIVTDLWDYIKQMFQGIYQIFKGVFDLIKALLKGDGDAVIKAVANIIIGVLNLLIGAIGMAVNILQTIMVGTIRLLVGIVQGVINGLIAGASAIMKLLGGKGISWRIDLVGLVGKIDLSLPKLPKIPSLASGGYIQKEGLTYLHAGETVVPKNQSSGTIVFSPTINVNASISSDYDVRNLANKLNSYWAQEFQKTMRSRGSI